MTRYFAAAGLALASMLLLAGGSNAAIVYTIGNTSVQNCATGGNPNGSHGLWTNPNNNIVSNSNCGAYFSINPGSLFTFNNDDADPNNWTGSLVGTATNPNGIQASFDITLTDFAEVYTPFKACPTCPYDPGTDTPDIDFFTNGSGTITVNSIVYQLAADPWAGDYAFQFGPGANDKAFEFGASTWMNIVGLHHHMDLNLTLARRVPEPSIIALFAIGLFSLGLMARRRRRRLAAA